MLQAAVRNGLTLDTLTIGQDLFGATEVDVRRREVFDTLMIAVMVVVLDESADLTFEVPR